MFEYYRTEYALRFMLLIPRPFRTPPSENLGFREILGLKLLKPCACHNHFSSNSTCLCKPVRCENRCHILISNGPKLRSPCFI